MMCEYRFISSNKYTPLRGGMFIMREAMHLWEQRGYGKISVPYKDISDRNQIPP